MEHGQIHLTERQIAALGFMNMERRRRRIRLHSTLALVVVCAGYWITDGLATGDSEWFRSASKFLLIASVMAALISVGIWEYIGFSARRQLKKLGFNDAQIRSLARGKQNIENQ